MLGLSCHRLSGFLRGSSLALAEGQGAPPACNAKQRNKKQGRLLRPDHRVLRNDQKKIGVTFIQFSTFTPDALLPYSFQRITSFKALTHV